MSFDHREPGTDPLAWTALLATLSADPVDPAAYRSVVVVAPHPDDESLGAGGLIAASGDAGLPVHVLLVTAGEGSHPDSPTTTATELRDRRLVEFTDALAVLDPAATSTFLDVADGMLRESPDVLERALDDLLAAAVGPVLVVAPWRGDGHRDHRIAGETAERAVAAHDGATLLVYPVWTWHWDDPTSSVAPWDDARALALDPAVLDRKRTAVEAYPSQRLPLSASPGDEPIVDDRHAAHHLRDVEWYFAPRPDGASPQTSRSRASFDAHYERHPQGWDFDGSWYERRKRAVTMAALPRERYRSAVEIGCATGVLTAAISDRADVVLGLDIAEAPLEIARVRAPRARFRRGSVPDDWPDGRFDLIVLSEIGYYLTDTDLDATIDRALGSLSDDGVLVACHWRHPDTEAVSDGDAVDRRITARWPHPALVRHVEDDFVLSVMPAAGVRSVARAEGIVG